MKVFLLYKGLQKPLVYRGFKGKFIGYGIASLALGLVLGGVLGALVNMYVGGLVTIASIAGGLFFTFSRQRSGLHDKSRSVGIFMQGVNLRRGYAKTGV